MKDKKLIVLYLAMIIVGLALLFTKSAPPPVEQKAEPIVAEPPKKEEPKTEIINVAVAKRDINKKTILTKDDYYFKSIEVAINRERPNFITEPARLDAYVVKNHIAKDTVIEESLIASPNSEDYVLLALKEGNYMFPFNLDPIDSYLMKNLKSGDLIDLYVFYGDETEKGANIKEDKLVSPSRDFVKNRLKPIIVGKKVLYFDRGEDELDKNYNKNNAAQVQLELSNQEIKLLRTLMTNSTIIMYPSTFKKNVEDGLRLLSDKEKNWPLSEKDIFSGTRINLLKGN
ncbi:SAF domain-containing protein [Gilliamella apicola]|uniref:SAF domain-containing protein n=1 Tax=Gilliamella apicola TaxID=1196095 RepID=UPI002FEE0DDA